MSNPSLRTARSNRVLAALPRDTLERLLPDLQLRSLPMREVLQARDVMLSHVVFPLAGVASMISMGDSGGSVEVATIGSEGMVGMPLLLGGLSAAGEVFMQVPGEGMSMAAARFRHHLEAESGFSRILLLYTQALLTQIAQCSACNSHHPISARCARWLLQTRDRVTADEFPLTHEFLGLMLGVRRASVSEAAHTLQARGLIRYSRGVVTILNAGALEKTACECYRLINREYSRLMRVGRRQVAR